MFLVAAFAVPSVMATRRSIQAKESVAKAEAVLLAARQESLRRRSDITVRWRPTDQVMEAMDGNTVLRRSLPLSDSTAEVAVQSASDDDQTGWSIRFYADGTADRARIGVAYDATEAEFDVSSDAQVRRADPNVPFTSADQTEWEAGDFERRIG
jgi:Tfp pilus assembly protein FimT